MAREASARVNAGPRGRRPSAILILHLILGPKLRAHMRLPALAPKLGGPTLTKEVDTR